MTLTELRFIVILAEERHFGRAATRCHVSQPTLSIAIKKLEDELGIAIFERTKGAILTTELGAQIVARAQAALEQTLAIKDLADTGKNQLHAPLRLGTLNSIGPYWLPQAIAYLQNSAPNMPVHLEEGRVDPLAKKLRAGKLDVILITQPFSEAEVVSQVICEEDFVLLMPHHHPLAVHPVIALDDLATTPLLLGTGEMRLRDQLLEQVPNLQYSLQNASLEMMRLMVASGLGVSVVPRCAAQAPLYGAHALVFRPLAAPTLKRTLALAWRASFPRHKAIDVLRGALQANSAAFWDFTTSRELESHQPLVDNRDW